MLKNIILVSVTAMMLLLAGCSLKAPTAESVTVKSTSTQGRDTISRGLIGVTASNEEIAVHLSAIESALAQAHAHADAATTASSVAELKELADAVFQVVWGHRSDLTAASGAVQSLGWREQWQATYDLFDPAFAARYGKEPGAITDPARLGIVGRGRYVRRALTSQPNANPAIEGLVASLNNIIGWQRLDDGVTKAERQPRIDLTYMWDAEQAFWLSSADTGWLFEVASQATNILKTNYQGDLGLAQSHGADLLRIIDRCIQGFDQNEDGSITPTPMEGGLQMVLAQAIQAGLR